MCVVLCLCYNITKQHRTAFGSDCKANGGEWRMQWNGIGIAIDVVIGVVVEMAIAVVVAVVALAIHANARAFNDRWARFHPGSQLM